MNDVADNDAREAPLTLGAILARGREEHGLTRNDVAQRLHMSPSQVEALEAGDYARLPKGTFLRGFVRNYAKLVALDPASVLPLLAENAPRDQAPGIVVPTQNIRFDPLSERFSSPWWKAASTAFVVIGFALAAMYWWIFVRPQPPGHHDAQGAEAPATASSSAPAAPPAEPSPSSSTMVPATSTVTPATAAAAAPVASPATSPVPSATPSAPPQSGTKPAPPAKPEAKGASAVPAPSAAPTQPDAVKIAAAPVAKGERRLHFQFKGESWVEVRDATGHVVFRQLNPAGSEANVSGKPPLQVVVGHAAEVELESDGKPFDLGPVSDVDVARFKVE